MKLETLQQANELGAAIGKLNYELEILGRPSVVVNIAYTARYGNTTFTTIGTNESCEHPETANARAFIDSLIHERMNKLRDAQDKLAAL